MHKQLTEETEFDSSRSGSTATVVSETAHHVHDYGLVYNCIYSEIDPEVTSVISKRNTTLASSCEYSIYICATNWILSGVAGLLRAQLGGGHKRWVSIQSCIYLERLCRAVP